MRQSDAPRTSRPPYHIVRRVSIICVCVGRVGFCGGGYFAIAQYAFLGGYFAIAQYAALCFATAPVPNALRVQGKYKAPNPQISRINCQSSVYNLQNFPKLRLSLEYTSHSRTQSIRLPIPYSIRRSSSPVRRRQRS